ncbi:ThiF family adenylyltransferase [Zhihengliuella halotolerans]|uniref:ThiF family adenylyltransferase n=1 Tax=Zhihengliuella halotolerans TaxID=370736 RepID=UPI000C80C161|nr:ThiF family adenylyltransferase [Zhihengliuella halotolerans]
MSVIDPTSEPPVAEETNRPPLGLAEPARRINPGLRLYRLTATSVCIGLGARGIWIGGVSDADRAYLARLAASGSHVDYPVADTTLPPAPRCRELDRLVEPVLVEAGSYRLPGLRADIMAPDVADWSLAYAAHAGPALQRRDDAVVRVHGLGRAGAQAAQLLAAAGVGTIVLDDSLDVRPADLGTGPLSMSDLGRPRAAAVTRRLESSHPQTRVISGAREATADITLLFADPATGLPRHSVAGLDAAHLPVRFEDSRAVVGPLVLPGLTPCLRCCVDHPVASPSSAPVGTEVTLAATAAGIAVMHALMLLDRVNVPASAGHEVAVDLASGATSVTPQRTGDHCGCMG